MFRAFFIHINCIINRLYLYRHNKYLFAKYRHIHYLCIIIKEK